MWGRGLESKKEDSTLETGGLPPLGGPLWYPPGPAEQTQRCEIQQSEISIWQEDL